MFWKSLSLLDFQTLQILPSGNVRVYCSFPPTWCVAGLPRNKRGDAVGLRSVPQGSSQEAFSVLMCSVTRCGPGGRSPGFFSILRTRHALQRCPGFPLLRSCFGHSTPGLWPSTGRRAPLRADGGHVSCVIGTARGRVGSSSSSGHLGRRRRSLSCPPARGLSVRRLRPLEIWPGPALG